MRRICKNSSMKEFNFNNKIMDEKIVREKPKEILELERIYGIDFYEIALSKNNYYVHNCFSRNESGEIIQISINDVESFDISFLSKLTSLEVLNLERNNLSDIKLLPLCLGLKHLDLGNNMIKDLSTILQYKSLESLNIYNNPIEDLSFLVNLKSIKHLLCWNMRLEDLDFSKGLLNLNNLHSNNNNLKDIAGLKDSFNLIQLTLSSNDINDISPLVNLKNLDFLDLDNNNITFIPKQIANNFDWLGPDGNISLNENPLEFPPHSVIELGKEVTKNYYEAAEKYGDKALSEGRIIFIGDGSSGKSSIIEKITKNSFTLGREQTNGIKIDNLYLQHPEDGRDLNFHIWDFGGQEIQHAVHKFFFTEGCLYVLVLDNRKEEEPEYWLQQIESLGGGASVLVVFNKQDENAAETADRKFLKEKYPNIVGFYNTSCKTGIGIDEFKNKLQEEVVKLRTVSERFPNNWLAVKKAIEENTSGTNHYLTYEAYREICKQNNLVTEEAQKLLLKYFNTIGTVTWFGEDVHLQNMHVLNPAWITQGVYKILTAKKTTNLFGQIKVKDFKELLQPIDKNDYTYDEKNYGYLLTMMKIFGLCYTADDKNLLIPSALGKVPKVEYGDFKGEQVRTYILQFKDYMPLALIHRFTAQKMPEALESNYWYTGIVIKDSVTETLAMVHADKEAKRIYVRIKGDSQLGVWEHVRRDIASITSNYAKIPYDELVALDEKNISTVNYQDLVSHVKAGKQTYFQPKLQKDFNVGYLMGLFEPKENTIEKIKTGEIILNEREHNKELVKIPPIIVNILNNNSPVVNANINTQIHIDIDFQLVHKKSSDIKGDANYLLDALGESNKALSETLAKVIQFADDAKTARNSGDIKEKGWGRKLKTVLETLSKTGEQFGNIKDGGEVVKSILQGIKDLAQHINLDAVTGYFS